MKREIRIASLIGGSSKRTKAVEEYKLDVSDAIMDDLRQWIRWAQKYAADEEKDG